MADTDRKSAGDAPAPYLGAAYALKTPDDNRALYRTWAETYDSGYVAERAYRYPEAIAGLCFDECAGDTTAPRVLDIGCGTGLVGQALRNLLPDAIIDGLDISPEMIAVAQSKGIYGTFFERDLTAPRQLPTGYDAVVSAGTFTHGHVGPGALRALIGTAKPGAVFVLGVNAEFYASQTFEQVIQDLETRRQTTEAKLVEGRVYAETAEHDHASDQFLALVFRAI